MVVLMQAIPRQEISNHLEGQLEYAMERSAITYSIIR